MLFSPGVLFKMTGKVSGGWAKKGRFFKVIDAISIETFLCGDNLMLSANFIDTDTSTTNNVILHR